MDSRVTELTGEGDGAVDGEDAGLAGDVTELAVGVAGEDLAAVAAEELDGGGGGGGRSDHACWGGLDGEKNGAQMRGGDKEEASEGRVEDAGCWVA